MHIEKEHTAFFLTVAFNNRKTGISTVCCVPSGNVDLPFHGYGFTDPAVSRPCNSKAILIFLGARIALSFESYVSCN